MLACATQQCSLLVTRAQERNHKTLSKGLLHGSDTKYYSIRLRGVKDMALFAVLCNFTGVCQVNTWDTHSPLSRYELRCK